MATLYICPCGLVYGEPPETTGEHPHNFCPKCDRVVHPSECRQVPVLEDDWIMTPKNHYQPNYLK